MRCVGTKSFTMALSIINFLILFCASVLAANLTVTWDPNSESDLAGYNIYMGESSGNYTGVVDVGNVTQFTWNDLANGKTYYFAVTAYDFSANESGFSDEVKATPGGLDSNLPELVAVSVKGETQIDVTFSEPVDKESAENKANYAISSNVEILGAILGASTITVHLVTTSHENDKEYTLTVNNIKDLAEDPNKIAANSQITYDFESNGGGITPQTFALFQNYPNPFNPETEIRFFLEKRRVVELKVYNPLGQVVKSLVKDSLPAGFHTIIWDGTNSDDIRVPSGVYIYSLEVKRDELQGELLVNVSLDRRVKKMTLIR